MVSRIPWAGWPPPSRPDHATVFDVEDVSRTAQAQDGVYIDLPSRRLPPPGCTGCSRVWPARPNARSGRVRSAILLRTVADMAPCRGRLTTLEHPRRTQTRPGVLRPKPAGSPSTDPRRRHRADPQP